MKKSIKVLAATAAVCAAALVAPAVSKAAVIEDVVIDGNTVYSANGREAGTNIEGNEITRGYIHTDFGNKNGGYIKFVASEGAVVSYGTNENKLTETQSDGVFGDAGNKNVYYKIPVSAKTVKNGGSVFFKDGDKTLKVEFKKGNAIEDKTDIKCKATFTAEASKKPGEYGKIEVKIGDKDVATGYSIYTANKVLREDVVDDVAPNESKWTEMLKPVIREGATVYVEPYMNYVDKHKKTYTVTTHGALTANGIDITNCLVKETYNVKAGKIKIAKQKAAPKAKLDAVNEKLTGVNTKMEFQYATEGGVTWSKWEKFTANKPELTKVTKASVVASGLSIRVRTAGTTKAAPSVVKTVVVPSRQALDLTQIATGTGIFTTNASLTVKDASATKVYQIKNDASGKWKDLKKSEVVKATDKKKVEAGKTFYIRVKGVNEKKSGTVVTPAKMPSPTVKVVAAASGSCIKWTVETVAAE